MALDTRDHGPSDSKEATRLKTPKSSVGWGVLAGTLGISCCVYPVVLVLIGVSTVAAAIDLGNFLFYEWGWAFRLAGIAFAGLALYMQRRRFRSCPADEKPRIWKSAVVIGGVGVVTYGALYWFTTYLGTLGA